MSDPTLILQANFWSLTNKQNDDGSDWSAVQKLEAIAAAGFEACTCAADTPGLTDHLSRLGLRYGGFFDASAVEHFAPRIAAALAIDSGPMNCQLADHDTPVEEAERQNAIVHLEVHRDTCTETPEKTAGIAEGVKAKTGKYPLINYDYSHPASVKHLGPGNYCERLFDNIPVFQTSRLWHMRPFNGHHCQVPVTDGTSAHSPEYVELRPFIKQAFKHWLAGPRPGNELWVTPEIGPKIGYGLSCFPDSWHDAVELGKDLRILWAEALAEA
jgi:hypothetical protein